MQSQGLLVASVLALTTVAACAVEDSPDTLPDDTGDSQPSSEASSTQTSGTEASDEASTANAPEPDSTTSGTETAGEEASLPDGFELELTEAWACGDVQLHLANPERTIMLTLTWPGLLANAEKSGTDVTWEVDFGLPSDVPIVLVVQTGTQLDASTCMGEGPATVEHTWSAVDGTARLTVYPSELAPIGWAGAVSAWLTDIELLAEGGGSAAPIEELEVLDVPIEG